MTDRQVRWAQLTLAIVAVGCAVYLLFGCTPDRTIEQDLAVCKSMCEPRPIEEFGSGSEFKTMTCRCGQKEKPPNPCPDAGKLPFGTW
jgi:hypothetical protein